MKVTNISPGPRGVNSTSGPVLLGPGESQDVELDAAEFKVAKATGWFGFDGKEPEEKRSQSANDTASSDSKKAAAQKLLDESDGMHHATLVAETRKILGDGSPDTKAEAIEALKKAAA